MPQLSKKTSGLSRGKKWAENEGGGGLVEIALPPCGKMKEEAS